MTDDERKLFTTRAREEIALAIEQGLLRAKVVSPKLAYSIEETIASTGIGRSTIFEEIKAGRLKARKRGRSTIILTGDLAKYLEALPVMA